ncbi:hypothetical protein ACJIZ3_019972 [Penstemon smallii]|uniref:Uncharacterized protein n=1 Tax=Penstemon smallii TaxID=265156 RepID=A0ABD3T2S0_9LAMI
MFEFLQVGFFYDVRELTMNLSFHEFDSVVVAINRGISFNLTC